MVVPNTDDLSLPNECELLSLAQAGSEEAFTMLVAQYEPILRAQVAHFRFPSADAEDAAQEGLLGLLFAVRSFDPSREASFRTYASTCVRNRLLSFWRRRAGHASEVLVEDVTAVTDVAVATDDPAAQMLERESAALMLERIKAVLSRQEYAVLLRYLDGLPYTTIAAQLQITAKAVDNALQRARVKLRSLL